jgi:hypothetical protein
MTRVNTARETGVIGHLPAPFAGGKQGATMKRTLTALATAGLILSGAAVASPSALQSRTVDVSTAGFTPVQGYERERWDDRSASIRDREARINRFIERGIDDGRIDRREARSLYRELHDIRDKERAFLSDGRLDGRERAELNGDLDRLADNVRHQMRDGDRR